MNKIKQIFYQYIMSFGSSVLILVIISVFTPSVDWIKLLQVMAVAYLFPNIAYVFIERNDVSKPEMWIRRILAFLIYPISLTLFSIAFGLTANIYRSLIIDAILLVPEIVLYVVLILIIEKVQKKSLEKINKKLKENITETSE